VPSAEFSHATKTESSLDHAWRQLQKPETWEAIPGVDTVFDARHSPDGALMGYRFVATAGGNLYEGVAEVREADAPTKMLLSIDSGEIAGSIRTELAALGDAQIQITVAVRLASKGFLSGIFFPILSRVVENGLPDSVEDFAGRLAES
jgi:hypothetical protein